MKSFIVFTLIIAGISALPPQLTKGLLTSDERLITDTIAGLIEDVSQGIKDAGLDPLYIPHEQASYALPVPVLFNFNGQVKEFHCNGLSDIRVTQLTFGTLTLRLRLAMKLPLIEASLDKAEINAVLFGENINLSTSGRLAIEDLTVETDTRISIGIISGISISNINVNFRVGGVKSDMTVSGFGSDISPYVNHVIGTLVPNTLNNFQGEIDELLEIIIKQLLDDIL